MTKTLKIAAFGVLAALGTAGVAQAAPIFTLGNNPQQSGEQNILFGSSQTGTTINGTTNQTNTPVRFTSSQSLSTGGIGQAFLTPTNSSSLLTNFAFSVPGGTFTDFIFNPQIGGQPNAPSGTAAITVTASDGAFNFNLPLSNGNNFLTIVASSGETFSQVALTSSTGFNQLQQPRVSGVNTGGGGGGGGGGTPIPEPASMALLGAGVAALGLFGRRRQG